jgi:aminoglycoside phosphotransferase (APT) family kinase protein
VDDFKRTGPPSIRSRSSPSCSANRTKREHSIAAWWRSTGISAARTVSLPRPIAFDDVTGLVMIEELPGKDLIQTLGDVDAGEIMWRIGEMLAMFHQAPRVVCKSLSVREQIDDLHDMAGKIEKSFPDALPRLRACLARCLAVRWTDTVPDTLLHGAFRPKHVFVHDGRPALVDLDGMCVGHPAHDIGHFLSALYCHEAKCFRPFCRERSGCAADQSPVIRLGRTSRHLNEQGPCQWKAGRNARLPLDLCSRSKEGAG